MAADFPLLYVSAVSVEHALFTTVTLAIMGLAVAVALYSY